MEMAESARAAIEPFKISDIGKNPQADSEFARCLRQRDISKIRLGEVGRGFQVEEISSSH
jgi:hypothetical protein